MRDWEVMRDFLSRNYRPDVALCCRSVFEWQFMVQPDTGAANMYCAWDGDRLIGIQGYIPVQIFWGATDKPVSGAWTINWYVEKDYRRGVGWLLMRKLQDAFPVVMGIEASPDNQVIVNRLGWTFYPSLPRYLSVLDLEQASQMLCPEVSVQADLRPLLYAGETLARPHYLNEASGDYNPDWRLYPPMSYGVIRSQSYFGWRYFAHPVFKYFIATTGSLDRPAVCIYRIEQSFGDFRAKVGRIVDFFHPIDSEGSENGKGLIHAVLNNLREKGCAYADCFCSSHTYAQTLLEAGWRMQPASRQLLPVRLSPIERKMFTYNIEWGVAKQLPVPILEDTYFTKSDGDADRAAMLPELLEKS